MSFTKTIIQLAAGAIFGVAMVLSCTHDSPKQSDAATCDCPASEAPIAGRVVSIDGTPVTIAPGGTNGPSAACPSGMQFLSGGCSAANQTEIIDITIQQIDIDPKQGIYECQIKNNQATAVSVKATAVCLKPAS